MTGIVISNEATDGPPDHTYTVWFDRPIRTRHSGNYARHELTPVPWPTPEEIVAETLKRIERMIQSLRRMWYLRGRVSIAGRRLRYDACTAIPLAVLAILKEFEADCRSPYFHCVQDDNLMVVHPLIAEGERLALGDFNDNVWDSDSEAWADWLRRVAEVLPRLWD